MPTHIPTATPVTPTNTPTATATGTPTNAPTILPTNPSPTIPTSTATATETPTNTPKNTTVPTHTPTSTIAPTATRTSTTIPTNTPTSTPTATSTSAPTTTPATGTVTGTGGAGVNCRTGAELTYAVITVLREGQSVPYREPAQNGWQPVICAGQNGWISVTYLHPNTSTPTPSPTSTPGDGTGSGTVVNTGGSGLNCRTGAGMTFSVITVLREGQVVPVRGAAQNGWVPVTCGGREGWVNAAYLRVPSAGVSLPTIIAFQIPTAAEWERRVAAPTRRFLSRGSPPSRPANYPASIAARITSTGGAIPVHNSKARTPWCNSMP
ncbi:MAG: SH3 domain-containing protein [Thermomicrobiales bacterium]